MEPLIRFADEDNYFCILQQVRLSGGWQSLPSRDLGFQTSEPDSSSGEFLFSREPTSLCAPNRRGSGSNNIP